jgi:hypothetical protein
MGEYLTLSLGWKNSNALLNTVQLNVFLKLIGNNVVILIGDNFIESFDEQLLFIKGDFFLGGLLC